MAFDGALNKDVKETTLSKTKTFEMMSPCPKLKQNHISVTFLYLGAFCRTFSDQKLSFYMRFVTEEIDLSDVQKIVKRNYSIHLIWTD